MKSGTKHKVHLLIVGDGEEMVIFVTELTMNAECVLFLATHPSDEYLKYSEKLLIGTRRGELLSEIKRL